MNKEQAKIMAETKKIVSFTTPPVLDKALEKTAREFGTSKSAYLSHLIYMHCAHNIPKKERPTTLPLFPDL